MKLYDEFVLPHLINCACGMKAIQRQRAKVVPMAYGRVLEVGMGSGLNLPFYNTNKVDLLIGLEPSLGMRKKAEPKLQESELTIETLAATCEAIPLHDDSVDCVVLTYTLCTVPKPEQALSELIRVLKPSGQVLFSEHGLAAEESVRKWQRRINPIWRNFAGGCNLDRDISGLIESSGLSIRNLETGYVKGPKIATFQYWGQAEKRPS